MSFRLTCIEVSEDAEELSSEVSVPAMRIRSGKPPKPCEVWVDRKSATVYWRTPGAKDTDMPSSISVGEITDCKLESNTVVIQTSATSLSL
jgi:hypothetical protein